MIFFRVPTKSYSPKGYLKDQNIKYCNKIVTEIYLELNSS